MIFRFVAEKYSRCCYQKGYISNSRRHYKTLHMMSKNNDSLEKLKDYTLDYSYDEALSHNAHRKRHWAFKTFVSTSRSLWRKAKNNNSCAFKQLQKSREYYDTKISTTICRN